MIGHINTSGAIKWGDKLRNNGQYKFEFRTLYCSSVPFCYLASGNFNFNIDSGGMGLWDVLIPKLLIEEAGGVCKIKQIKDNKYGFIAGDKETVEVIDKIINV